MTDQWYIARDGQTFGPYTPEQIQELARIQPLLPTDQMLRAGTQQWRPALSIEELFAAPEPPPPAPEPTPEPEPEPVATEASSPEFTMGGSRSAARSRQRADSEGRMPMWFWLGPVGGAAVLGILTVVIMFSGRTRPTTPHNQERPPPVVRRRPVEPPPRPRVDLPPPPTDYTVPKADYTKGFDGATISLVVDTPSLRRQGYVNAKGKTIYHGKSEELYADSEQKKSEEWYVNGNKYGPSITWDETGAKTAEGQYFLGTKEGKWTAFRKDGSIAAEVMWHRGKKLGPSTTFHDNGKKAQTVEYKNDRRTGPAKAWDEAGKELTPEESLRADLRTVNYDDMIDILGPPRELHEAPKSKGALHIWTLPSGSFLAVWVLQDRQGMYTKRDVRAFGVTREALDKLKRELQ